MRLVLKKGIPDVKGERAKTYIRDQIGVPVYYVGTKTLYYFSDDLKPEQADMFGRVLLADDVVEDRRFLGDVPVYEQPEIPERYMGSWKIRVGYKLKPLIMDNWGEATRFALERIFDVKLGLVRKIDEYEITGELTKELIARVFSEEKLADSKVQTHIAIPGDKNG